MCDIVVVSHLATDATVNVTSTPGQFALDRNTDAAYPPLLVYQSPALPYAPGANAGYVNLTTWDPATGALQSAVPRVQEGPSVTNMGGVTPPVFAVSGRHVMNAGSYFNSRAEVGYQALGSVQNATAAAAGFTVIGSTWTTPRLLINTAEPVQMWSTPGFDWPIMMSQVTFSIVPASKGCYDAHAGNASVNLLSIAPLDSYRWNITQYDAPLASCALPSGACFYPAIAHARPLAARLGQCTA